MYIKDYYTILELSPAATTDEIKKAYRRLALLHHPDKKTGDPHAAARFTEIKEAYEVLTNPYKKDQYLQQRWYARSAGNKRAALLVTPENLLQQMLELDRYIRGLDMHRMNREGMYEYMSYLLSDENISRLNEAAEPEVNKAIFDIAFRHGHLVPYTSLNDFTGRLEKIKMPGNTSTDLLNVFARHRKQSYLWELWKPWLILIAVLLLCGSIVLITRNQG